jgi:N,N'-diacetylchitobiose transport system permease protein
MNTEEKKTLPLGLQQFVGRGDIDWGAVMATSGIYTLPVVIFFLLLRKRLMLGMSAGAVKG